MGYSLNDLGNALTTQIYHTVMGGDDKVKSPPNTFFTWCMPGLPFTADDLDFAAKGIFSAPTAEEQNKRAAHAYNLAVLLDFIPDVTLPYGTDRQEGMYKPDAEKHLSEMYRQVLRFSKVVNYELSDTEKGKLQKFRDLLYTTKTVKNLVTDEEEQVTEEGPVLKAYNQRLSAYLDAVTTYNAKRVAAAGAVGPEGKAASADWILNQQNYYLKVKAAADEWVSGGYRNEVDEMNAFINQVTQRSLVLWKQQLLEAYDKAQMSSVEVAIPFPYTTLVPANIAESGGWNGIGVNHSHIAWAQDESVSSWAAGGGINAGLFSFGANGGGTSKDYSSSFQVNSFELDFEICQAVIVRAGFYPEWFASRGWTLRKGEGWTFDDMPSDGGNPPKGSFIGYATQAIFARNVTITSADFVSAYHAYSSSFSGNANIGWGPFQLSGSYSRSDSHRDLEMTVDGEKLTVKGMQIIGFVNHLLGKAPNPLPDLKDKDFV